MIPRITIPDSDDESLVAAALVNYIHENVAQVMRGKQSSIPRLQRASDLLAALYDGAVQRKVGNKFGPIPSDEEIETEIKKMRDDPELW